MIRQENIIWKQNIFVSFVISLSPISCNLTTSGFTTLYATIKRSRPCRKTRSRSFSPRWRLGNEWKDTRVKLWKWTRFGTLIQWKELLLQVLFIVNPSMLGFIRLVLKVGQNYSWTGCRYNTLEYKLGRTVISTLEQNSPTSVQLLTCSIIHFVRLNSN